MSYPGFIDFIVDPSMNICGDMIDRILREELNSASNSPSADSVVRNKRNSIPMARPCSAPRSASVPAPANNNSMNVRAFSYLLHLSDIHFISLKPGHIIIILRIRR